MDRRTLLAFLLIFLVITGYQLLMSHEAQKRQPAPAASPARTVAEGEVAPAAPPPESAPPRADAVAAHVSIESALAPAGEELLERTIRVHTPLYVVDLASRGARITSWRGLAYADQRGEPVQLIPQETQAAPRGLDAIVFANKELDLGQELFTSEAPPRIDIDRGAGSVVFRLRTAGDLEIRKTYTFFADCYEITQELELVAAGPQAGASRAVLGPPRQLRFGWAQGIASTEPGDRLEEAAFRAFAGVGDGLEFKKRGPVIKNADKIYGEYRGTLRFAGIQNKYFTIVGLPAPEQRGAQAAKVVLAGDPARNVQTWIIEHEASGAGDDKLAFGSLVLYIGPQEAERLRAFGVGLDKTMDLGWALFRPLTEATLWIMAQMRRVIPNYGVIIILFSVLTKIAFYPLTRSSTQSMKRMQQMQPKIKELQAKFKDNREKQSQEMMKLYRKEKINPMAGCLPLLLQMPVFIALYQALAHTIALRNTPFFAWITDLSKPDALFTLPFSLPLLGADFNLLPLLMTATMVLQMRMTPTGPAPGQMAMMNTVMPVVFLFFFYQMPSGLVLYWLVNNVVTIYQTWRIHKTASPEGGIKTT